MHVYNFHARDNYSVNSSICGIHAAYLYHHYIVELVFVNDKNKNKIDWLRLFNLKIMFCISFVYVYRLLERFDKCIVQWFYSYRPFNNTSSMQYSFQYLSFKYFLDFISFNTICLYYVFVKSIVHKNVVYVEKIRKKNIEELPILETLEFCFIE